MKHKSKVLMTGLVGAIAFSQLALSCQGGSSPVSLTDPRACTTGGDDQWQAVIGEPERVEPRNCPYAANGLMPFRVILRADRSKVDTAISGSVSIVSTIDMGFLALMQVRWQIDPINSLKAMQDYNGSYFGGYTGNALVLSRDSAEWWVPTLGYSGSKIRAVGWMILPGTRTSGRTTMAGITSMPTGVGGTWSVTGEADTISYLYKWAVDGADQPEIGSKFAWMFDTPGPHSVQAIVTRSDYVADTLRKSINVTNDCTVNAC